MVMLMIKFGAYKAACCWVCAPSFRAATTKLMNCGVLKRRFV